MEDYEDSFLALLNFNAVVKTNTPVASPASFAASALVFASLVYVLVLHRSDFFSRFLNRAQIE